MNYLYSIAGLKILCEIPFSLTIDSESTEFIFPLEENDLTEADLTIQYCKTEAFLDFQKDSCYSTACRYFSQTETERKVYYCAAPEQEPYACVIWPCANPKQIFLYYLAGAEKYLNYGKNITGHLGLENLLWMWRGILLHSSFVSRKEKGILFSGPSGVGKSTQAGLWKKYKNAEIINGDRAAIRCMDGKWTAYGSPCAGSSGIYKNKSAEIKVIIILRQADSNRIRKMSPAEAFVALYPEVTIHGWDRKFVEDASECLKNLLADVPAYLLECLPNEEAVSLVRNII